jgi:probable addiction module antidote protein
MTLATLPFDIADHLGDAEAIQAFLADALETGDAGYIAHALGQIARARGMADIARRAGVSRETLYRTLGPEGNPRLDTLLQLLQAMDLRLTLTPV